MEDKGWKAAGDVVTMLLDSGVRHREWAFRTFGREAHPFDHSARAHGSITTSFLTLLITQLGQIIFDDVVANQSDVISTTRTTLSFPAEQ